MIGHAPRHLDRNITLAGRVLVGVDLLSSCGLSTSPAGIGRGGMWGSRITSRTSSGSGLARSSAMAIRRYAPEFLSVLQLRAAPAAQDVLDAINMLRTLNADNARKVPADAPIAFVKKRWAKRVITAAGIDRRYYELCAMAEFKNALRSGDIWVVG